MRYLIAMALLAPGVNYANVPTDPVECLARNIYFEAANEPLDGQIAVAQVTLNRVADPAYPPDVCGVVYFKRVVHGKKVAAFSWTLGRAWRAAGRIDQLKYTRCFWIALQMINGTLHSERIDGSVEWYHAVYIHPDDWAPRRVVAVIGKHVFYRE